MVICEAFNASESFKRISPKELDLTPKKMSKVSKELKFDPQTKLGLVSHAMCSIGTHEPSLIPEPLSHTYTHRINIKTISLDCKKDALKGSGGAPHLKPEWIVFILKFCTVTRSEDVVNVCSHGIIYHDSTVIIQMNLYTIR